MKRSLIYYFIFFVFSHSMFAQNAVVDMTRRQTVQERSQRAKLAIANFKAVDVPKAVAEKVQEGVTDYLIRMKKYKLVERSQIESIFREIALSQNDLFDRQTAIKVGKLIAARGIVVGTVMRIDNNLVINARLVDLQSGEIIRTSRAVTPYEQDMNRACAKIAFDIANEPVNENLIQDASQIFLDFPYWKQYLFGINVGVGLARRLGKFESYYPNDTFTNEPKFVQQASFRFMLFFSRTSNFGLMHDFGFYTYRMHEFGLTQEPGGKPILYFTHLTIVYFYYTVALIVRFREFHVYAGPYLGLILHADGKINPYQDFSGGAPESTYNIDNDKKLFKNPDFGIVLGAGITFKNLPHDIKFLISIEMKFKINNTINMDRLREVISKTYYNSADNIKLFSLYINFSLMFGL